MLKHCISLCLISYWWSIFFSLDSPEVNSIEKIKILRGCFPTCSFSWFDSSLLTRGSLLHAKILIFFFFSLIGENKESDIRYRPLNWHFDFALFDGDALAFTGSICFEFFSIIPFHGWNSLFTMSVTIFLFSAWEGMIELFWLIFHIRFFILLFLVLVILLLKMKW